MKKNTIVRYWSSLASGCGMAIIFLIQPIPGSPLDAVHSCFGSPFLLYSAPSLLYRVQEYPIGFQSDYSLNGDALLRCAVSSSVGENGFSIGYGKYLPSPFHQISLAGCQSISWFSFGSALHLLAGSTFHATADISLTALMANARSITIGVRNAVLTDTLFLEQGPEISILSAIPVSEKYRFTTEIEMILELLYPKKGEYAYQLKGMLQKEFFKKPALNIFAGADGRFQSSTERSLLLIGGFGFSVPMGSAVAGAFAGYRHDIFETNSSLYLGIMVNPTLALDRVAPSVAIALSDSVIILSRAGGKNTETFSLRCTDNSGGTGIDRWMIAISTDPESHNLVRTYSGGGIPPANIGWDGRDSRGQLLEAGAYFIRFTAIDKRGNVAQTASRMIEIKE